MKKADKQHSKQDKKENTEEPALKVEEIQGHADNGTPPQLSPESTQTDKPSVDEQQQSICRLQMNSNPTNDATADPIGPIIQDEKPLTPEETKQLKESETTIEDAEQEGWNAAAQIGRALTQIEQDRLYRETHKTFLEYCRDRWGYEQAHVYRLKEYYLFNRDHAKDAPFVKCEGHYRELKKLPEKLWDQVQPKLGEKGIKHPTAREIRTGIDEVLKEHGLPMKAKDGSKDAPITFSASQSELDKLLKTVQESQKDDVQKILDEAIAKIRALTLEPAEAKSEGKKAAKKHRAKK